LTEFLVVIAIIIAVLVGILLPTIRRKGEVPQ
jgi:hypothetical protein